ncbi:putative uncharacterized protein [Prevotella sp. CAG:891]|jgi:hypothetical protein|nr:putative uncharacterized protein [Prevotella sp. CAG:891]
MVYFQYEWLKTKVIYGTNNEEDVMFNGSIRM